MNRRSFFGRLGAAVVGLTLARHLPGIAPRPFTLPEPSSEIVTDGLSCGDVQYLKPGDVFTIAADYQVNPGSRGKVRHFRVTAVTQSGITLGPS